MSRSNRKKKTNLFPIFSIFFILCALVVLFVFIISSVKGQESDNSSQNSSISASSDNSEDTSSDLSQNDSSTTPSESGQSSTSEANISSEPPGNSQSSDVPASIDKNAWNLMLVNAKNPMPEGYIPKVSSINSEFMAPGFSKAQFDSRAVDHLINMLKAAKADGVNVLVRTGYRSISHQATLFDNKVKSFTDKGYSKDEAVVEAAKIVARPGTSEHNLALSVDFNSLSESFENTKEFKWLSENAADYGFILRYPKDKQHITGVIYEPWHYRYVGVEHAKAMKESGQCLEEYLGKE